MTNEDIIKELEESKKVGTMERQFVDRFCIDSETQFLYHRHMEGKNEHYQILALLAFIKEREAKVREESKAFLKTSLNQLLDAIPVEEIKCRRSFADLLANKSFCIAVWGDEGIKSSGGEEKQKYSVGSTWKIYSYTAFQILQQSGESECIAYVKSTMA